jgi:hypothetical protein
VAVPSTTGRSLGVDTTSRHILSPARTTRVAGRRRRRVGKDDDDADGAAVVAPPRREVDGAGIFGFRFVFPLAFFFAFVNTEQFRGVGERKKRVDGFLFLIEEAHPCPRSIHSLDTRGA